MKSIIAIVLVLMSATSFAAKCDKTIKANALKAINKYPGFNGDSKETRSVYRYKTLNASNFLETYIVGASDEVEPSDFILVVDPNKNCAIKFIGVANDGVGAGNF